MIASSGYFRTVGFFPINDDTYYESFFVKNKVVFATEYFALVIHVFMFFLPTKLLLNKNNVPLHLILISKTLSATTSKEGELPT